MFQREEPWVLGDAIKGNRAGDVREYTRSGLSPFIRPNGEESQRPSTFLIHLCCCRRTEAQCKSDSSAVDAIIVT